MMSRLAFASAQFTLAALLAASSAVVHAQDYPTKPIRLILPYAPGGSTSVLGRLVGHEITEDWGQQVLVDNRPGAGTVVGSDLLVKSPPDGYTILLVTSTHTILPSLRRLPFDSVKDFAPVTTLARAPFLFVIHPSLPAKTLRELIALAKARPDQLDYSSSGPGTSNHISFAMLSMAASIKLHHIPYKGGGPAIADLLGGQVHMHMNSPVNLIQHVRDARLRAIAVTGDSNLAALPDVPTFAQAGVPEVNIVNWFAILAPANTPKDIVDKLSAEIAKILRKQNIRDKFAALGADPWHTGPAKLADLIGSDIAKFANIIEAANIRLE